MNKLFIVIIIIVSTANIFSSCKKNNDENVLLIFEIPLSITPVKDTIKIGDTLTLQTNFSDSVKEVTTGRYFNLRNFDFKTTVSFLNLSSTNLFLSQQPGNASSYSVISNQGSITNLSESFGNITFEYMANAYFLKIKIIPKKAGVFNFTFFSKYIGTNTKLDFIDLGNSNSGGKKIAYLSDIHYNVNGGNTNYDLLKKNSRLASIENPNPENIRQEQKGTYTFVVK